MSYHANMSRGQLKLFSNRSGERFAKKVAKELRVDVSPMRTVDFADSETKICLDDSVRGCDVYVVQNCFDPTSKRSVRENFFEMLQAGDAFKMAGASKATAIMPYHPFSRQDKSTGRECLTASLAARLIEASGFDNVICSDLHSAQMIGFYRDAKIDNLPASDYLIAKFRELYGDLERLVVIAPDAGGAKRAELYAKKLHARPAQAFKIRSSDEANKVEELKVAGLVEDYNLLVVDDMIDTAGSLKKLVEKLKDKRVKHIYVCCTHPLLNGKATFILRELELEILTADTIPRTERFLRANPWYKEVSLAPLFARAVHNINNDQSVSELYNDDPKYL